MTYGDLPNENILISRAGSDPDAFAEVYDHYFPKVYSYVRSRVNTSNLADDLSSQIFERVLLKINTFQPERGSFSGWLFTIAHNIVSDYLRIENKQNWIALEETSQELACVRPGPEETCLDGEDRRNLLKALAKLTDRERSIIELKFWVGLNNRQIAQIVNLSDSNVGIILYRSIRHLRAIMVEKGSGKDE